MQRDSILHGGRSGGEEERGGSRKHAVKARPRMGKFSIFNFQVPRTEGGSWAVAICAGAQIFEGRCAGFFAHLRRRNFLFWFCKSSWLLGLSVKGDSWEVDAQLIFESGGI